MPGRVLSFHRRLPAALRLVVLAAVLVLVAVLVLRVTSRPAGQASAPADPVPLTGPAAAAGNAGAAGPGGRDDRRTLVLYDDGRRAGLPHAAAEDVAQAEAYAMFTANLVSRATAWDLLPAADYRRGKAMDYASLVYIGSVYDGELPAEFSADVLGSPVPVLWIGANIWQLFDRVPGAAGRLGWTQTGYRADSPSEVDYKGTALRRDPAAGTGVLGINVTDARKATVLAEAKAGQHSTPWAVRAGTLTYLAEVPYAYTGAGDRYLAAADILLGTLAPDTAERHRALVRIEDVGPRTDPAQIRAITSYLASKKVPFSLAVYPYYTDPLGKANNGQPTFARLVDSPDLVDALREATERGATLLMHGYSHQYREQPNPYDGVSAADFEFFRAALDQDDNVRLSGPVPEDSPQWFSDRIATGLGEFARVGLPRPAFFEFPHYAGSAADYQAVTPIFGARYDRGSYYAGFCPGGKCGSSTVSYQEVYGQFFPYPVRDVYGAVVVPENIGNVAPSSFNQHSARSGAEMVADAATARVVRDNVASFFYHPFLGTDGLAALVDGISGLGYQFASPGDVLRG
ncbi:DUF2334 domain-containing protein [Amycolatopsis nigrescens]|uniref:DUF2334 domain-containing protein n=1 Tax=Amycolatopsis nigrescens TaxID=381445 RepID=UPI0003A477A8|nr:DUF2334 domain-containing protein [Amycolatopsis nigrescens]